MANPSSKAYVLMDLDCMLQNFSFSYYRAVEEFVTRFPQHVNLKRPADFHVPLHIAAANNRLDAVTLLARVVGNYTLHVHVPGYNQR